MILLAKFNRFQEKKQPVEWRRWQEAFQRLLLQIQQEHWQTWMNHRSTRRTWMQTLPSASEEMRVHRSILKQASQVHRLVRSHQLPAVKPAGRSQFVEFLGRQTGPTR